MTEAEWLTCTEPQEMLIFLETKAQAEAKAQETRSSLARRQDFQSLPRHARRT